MARKRVVRGAGLKAKVALAALSGSSPSQVASRFGVHPTQVATWKKRLLEGAPELFVDGRRRTSSDVEEQELYEQIGRLQMELAWLKKKVAQVE
jgi:transposase-like protein